MRGKVQETKGTRPDRLDQSLIQRAPTPSQTKKIRCRRPYLTPGRGSKCEKERAHGAIGGKNLIGGKIHQGDSREEKWAVTHQLSDAELPRTPVVVGGGKGTGKLEGIAKFHLL